MRGNKFDINVCIFSLSEKEKKNAKDKTSEEFLVRTVVLSTRSWFRYWSCRRRHRIADVLEHLRVGGRGQGQGSNHGFASSHDPNPVFWGCPTVQTSRVPRHQRDLPTRMTDAGESLRDPSVLRGTGGFPCLIFNSEDADGVADVAPERRTIPGDLGHQSSLYSDTLVNSVKVSSS
ncbi:hypothetical protein E2C01_009391 [Portunus trituberculatus]|uniref:Uncharacterized protein n=1 Tax=Portunus trituberculatus TaxID=210409 RepID=A0A5B7D3E8_PORTR|nr:hypothetical protein [Portunus trituberculatus]